jgi:hypothetical protein
MLRELLGAPAAGFIPPLEGGNGLDILPHGHMREKPYLLDGIADIPAQLAVDYLGVVHAVDVYLTAGNGNQAVYHLHGGHLTAPGRPEEDAYLPFVDFEAHPVNGFGTVLIYLGYFFQFNNSLLPYFQTFRCNPPLNQSHQAVNQQGQDGYGHPADDDEIHPGISQPAKNRYSESSGAYYRRDGRNADNQHDGVPYPGHNNGYSQGKLDFKEDLSFIHAHAPAGFYHGRVDRLNRLIGIAQNRELPVDDEGDDSGEKADGRQTDATEERHQKSVKCQTGDGHHNLGKIEDGIRNVLSAFTRDVNPQGNAEGNENNASYKDQPQVVDNPPS